MEDEKKIKLEELPDAGSEPQTEHRPLTHPKKNTLEPRIESLKKLDRTQQMDALGQRWYFEKVQKKWDRLLALLGLIVLQKTGLLLELAGRELSSPSDGDFIDLSFIREELLLIFRYPIGFAIFIPIFFKFRYPSLDHFEITFGGINSIRELDVPGNLPPSRVFVKWNDITSVKLGEAKGRPVLMIFGIEGKTAEVIWDIDDIKKKVVKQVLKGLVSPKNPFRDFIEKDVV